MTRFLSLNEVLELHRVAIEDAGGSAGVRDFGMLQSAVSQPAMAFSGQDLYPTVIEKAAAICFSLIMNHPFVDGNKRVGHAAMDAFLVLNGHEMQAGVEEQERVILDLAAGQLKREDFIDWVRAHIVERSD